MAGQDRIKFCDVCPGMIDPVAEVDLVEPIRRRITCPGYDTVDRIHIVDIDPEELVENGWSPTDLDDEATREDICHFETPHPSPGDAVCQTIQSDSRRRFYRLLSGDRDAIRLFLSVSDLELPYDFGWMTIEDY